jgi:hypothetical protein
MSLIEKYKAWAKYSDKYTAAQVLTEIVADLTCLEQEQAKNCNIQRVIKLACLCPRTKYDDCDRAEPCLECDGCHYFRQACL